MNPRDFTLFLLVVMLATDSEPQAQQGRVGRMEGIPMARTYFDDKSSNYVIDFTGDPAVEQLWSRRQLFEDNVFTRNVVNLVYSSKTNRMYGRSASNGENYDPVDISMSRTPEPGAFENSPWSLLGQIGARVWGRFGTMHYGSTIQFYTLDPKIGTISTCISPAPGRTTYTIYAGHNEGGQHAQCMVLVTPQGIVLGYDYPQGSPVPVYIPGQLVLQQPPIIDGRVRDPWKLIAPDAQTEMLGLAAMRKQMFVNGR